MCGTRWTAGTEAIGAVMETLSEVHQTTCDEYGIKAYGLLSALEIFSTLFGLKLCYLIFGASETLSKSLQGKGTTLQEALAAVNLAKAFHKRQRTNEAFNLFNGNVVTTAERVAIGMITYRLYERYPFHLLIH